MKIITSTEFKNNIKKYAKFANSEKVLVTRKNGESFFIVPASQMKDIRYDQIFVQEILQSIKEAELNNDYVIINSLKDLQHLIDMK